MIENRIKYDQNSTFPEPDGQSERCKYCNRTFYYDSLKRHQLICYRNNVKHHKQPSKVPMQFNSNDIEYIKIADLLNRKKKRRNQWRNDHLNLIKQLEISQETRNYSRNLSPESSSSDLLSWDISNFSEIEEPYLKWKSIKINELPIQDNTNYKTSQPNRRNSSKHIKDISEQLSNLKANERRTFYENRVIGQSDSLESATHKQSSLSMKDLSKISNGIEISSKFNQKKTNLCKSNNELNKINNNCANIEKSFQQQAIHRYEQNIKKVLQLYSEKYWLNENKNYQNVLENIPKNLSIQRQKLEKLKQFHNERKLNNHVNKMLSVSANNIFEDSNNKWSNDKGQKFALERSESNLQEIKEQEINENLSNNKQCNENTQICKCSQLKGILKSKEKVPEIIDSHNQMKSSRLRKIDSEPFINVKLNKFKQHIQSMNNFNSHSTVKNDNCQTENEIIDNYKLCTVSQAAVNDITNLSKDLDHPPAENHVNTYRGPDPNNYEVPANQSKQTNHHESEDQRVPDRNKMNLKTNPSLISLKSQTATPHVEKKFISSQQILLKPFEQSNKINDTIAPCETRILREAYAEAWKVKL